jgi:hypothetical protein
MGEFMGEEQSGISRLIARANELNPGHKAAVEKGEMTLEEATRQELGQILSRVHNAQNPALSLTGTEQELHTLREVMLQRYNEASIPLEKVDESLRNIDSKLTFDSVFQNLTLKMQLENRRQ